MAVEIEDLNAEPPKGISDSEMSVKEDTEEKAEGRLSRLMAIPRVLRQLILLHCQLRPCNSCRELL